MTGITCVAGEKNPLPLVGREIVILKICYTLWTMDQGKFLLGVKPSDSGDIFT